MYETFAKIRSVFQSELSFSHKINFRRSKNNVLFPRQQSCSRTPPKKVKKNFFFQIHPKSKVRTPLGAKNFNFRAIRALQVPQKCNFVFFKVIHFKIVSLNREKNESGRIRSKFFLKCSRRNSALWCTKLLQKFAPFFNPSSRLATKSIFVARKITCYSRGNRVVHGPPPKK